MERKRTLLASTTILAAALLFMGYQLKTPTQQIQNQNGITHTISVAGEGKSYATPDTLIINASVSELGKTTKDAQTQMDTKITKIKELLTSFDIKKEKLQTTNLNIYPEYDRGTTNQKKLLGYRAQQSISIEIQGENFAQKGADIINKIAEVGNINIDNTNFTLKNKEKAIEEAREKAFEDAKYKAEQLAKLGNVTLGKPTMITDQEDQSYPSPMYALRDMKTTSAEAGNAMNTAPLSPGQMELNSKISIVYEIK